jgi:hypothetical protein
MEDVATPPSAGRIWSSSGFCPQLERSLGALPQLSAVAGIRPGVVKIYGKVTPVVATEPGV